jgi:glycosyltransferase involved in cell wall biosynthesis
MKLAIVIATYQRIDNTTPVYLTRALTAIKNQTYQDYKVFLIGDCYSNSIEFELLATLIISADKIYYENLPIAVERTRYPYGGIDLWRSGGANARNHGIDIAIQHGYKFICHLDHDDYWDTNHLEVINDTININPEVAFIHTQSTYLGGILPNTPTLDDIIIERPPVPEGLIHSSVCINYELITLRYRDTLHEIGIPNASDADKWGRIAAAIEYNGFKSYYVPQLTCFHPIENH